MRGTSWLDSHPHRLGAGGLLVVLGLLWALCCERRPTASPLPEPSVVQAVVRGQVLGPDPAGTSLCVEVPEVPLCLDTQVERPDGGFEVHLELPERAALSQVRVTARRGGLRASARTVLSGDPPVAELPPLAPREPRARPAVPPPPPRDDAARVERQRRQHEWIRTQTVPPARPRRDGGEE